MKYVRKRKTKTKWYHLYMDSKIWHEWTYLWNRNRLTDIEETCGCQEEGGWGGMDWKFAASRCNLLILHIEWTNNVLLSSTENYIQYPAINHKAKEHERYIYVTELLCYRAQIRNTLQINYSSIKNISLKKKKSSFCFLARRSPLCGWPTFCLSVHLVMDIWMISSWGCHE